MHPLAYSTEVLLREFVITHKKNTFKASHKRNKANRRVSLTFAYVICVCVGARSFVCTASVGHALVTSCCQQLNKN